MGMAILMFVLPARKRDGRTEFLMDWETAVKLPWGILLLFGGGFALAGAFQSTGFSAFLGNQFSTLIAGWPVWLIVAATVFLLTFLSELTSNVATVLTIVPVIAKASVALGLDPRLVMIPATIAASCGFMLPIATPPNAIVYGTNQIPLPKMLRYGLALDLLAVLLITGATFLLIVPQMGISLEGIPDWAVPKQPSLAP
jgi:sodium-dependent dicarboxylate transporter 2/3/5